MNIEIDDDFVEDLVSKSMVDNYIMVKSFLKNEKNSHPEDVANWKELLPALELVGNWYTSDFAAAVKKASKKK
jgi:hypothetical protein